MWVWILAVVHTTHQACWWCEEGAGEMWVCVLGCERLSVSGGVVMVDMPINDIHVICGANELARELWVRSNRLLS